jgi:rod shape-determining protein MreC
MDAAYWRDQAGQAARESLGARYNLRSASIVSRDPQSLNSMLVVNKGLLNGIRTNMAAVNDAGVAGRVVEAGINLSFVATIHNPRVRIAALDVRSRVAGIIGAREGSSLLTMDYVPPDADIAQGDTILTSGTGGVFPKGLGIGLVVRTDSAPRGMFRPVVVRPFVRVSALENVYLVEPLDWTSVEQQRQAARDELDATQQKDLRDILDGSQFERK